MFSVNFAKILRTLFCTKNIPWLLLQNTFLYVLPHLIQLIEAACLRGSSKKMFWKYAAKLQENTLAEVRFQ